MSGVGAGARLRRFALLAVVAALAAVFFWFAGELALRVRVGVWFAGREAGAALGFSHPGGAREVAPTLPPSAGVLRVLAIGGSITHGLGVPLADTWPKQLERDLAKLCGRRVEVLNLGMPGGHLEEFIANSYGSLRRRWPREREAFGLRAEMAPEASGAGWKDSAPALVVLAPTVNEAAPDLLAAAAERARPRAFAAWRWLMDGPFAAYGWAKLGALALAQRIIDDKDLPAVSASDERLAPIAARYRDRIARFLEAWRGTKVLLARPPVLFSRNDLDADSLALAIRIGGPAMAESAHQADALVEAARIDEEVLGAAAPASAGLVRAGEALMKLPLRERLRFYTDGIHFNAAGHAMLAKDLARPAAAALGCAP